MTPLRTLLAITLLTLLSCGEDQPAGIIAEETFAKVYVALQESGRTSSPLIGYGIRKFDPDTTLVRFGVTREQLEKTMEYYDEDLERWKRVYAMIVSLQESRKEPRAQEEP
jgi:hypothetical protein